MGLNLKLPMYLGGPDPTAVLSSNAGTSVGFIGCVAEVRKKNDTITQLAIYQYSLMKHLKISSQKHRIDSILQPRN